MAHPEIEIIVAQAVERAVAPCLSRIAELEARVSELDGRKPEARCLADLPEDAAVDFDTLAAFLVCSVKTLRRMIDRGELPKPVRWGGRRKVWTAGKLCGWLRQREASSQEEEDTIARLLGRREAVRAA